jgi:hypothetical protein
MTGGMKMKQELKDNLSYATCTRKASRPVDRDIMCPPQLILILVPLRSQFKVPTLDLSSWHSRSLFSH